MFWCDANQLINVTTALITDHDCSNIILLTRLIFLAQSVWQNSNWTLVFQNSYKSSQKIKDQNLNVTNGYLILKRYYYDDNLINSFASCQFLIIFVIPIILLEFNRRSAYKNRFPRD